MSAHYVLTVCLLTFGSFASATDYYVGPGGADVLAGGRGLSEDAPFATLQYAADRTAPGDVVYVMNGTYRNVGFGSGARDNKAVAYISTSGEAGAWITFRNYPGHTPTIQFDGAGGFIAGEGINYIRVEGFTIQGNRADITLADALANRQTRPVPTWFNGCGVAFWGPSHHIVVSRVKAIDCPNSGIRVDQGDYVTFTDNVVGRNAWYSPNGPSGMVIARAKAIDENTGVKMKILRNVAFENTNLVPIFFPWAGEGEYGGPDYAKASDGRGIYMTRNEDYRHGTYLIANNVTYDNGFAGITFHKSRNGIIRNNTAYRNGTEGSNRQGITVANAVNLEVSGNIVVARGGGAIFDNDRYAGPSSNVRVFDNLIDDGFTDYSPSDNRLDTDPQFVDPAKRDFRLRATSPAVDQLSSGETSDKQGTARPQRDAYDIGAFEYNTIPFGRTIWLRSKRNNRFLTGETASSASHPQVSALAARNTPDTKFKLRRSGIGAATLKWGGNGKFVRVRRWEKSQVLRAMAPSVDGGDELFYVYQHRDGSLSFKAHDSDKYAAVSDASGRSRAIAGSFDGVNAQFSWGVKFVAAPAALTISGEVESLSIYPNPVQGARVTAAFPRLTKRTYTRFEVFDARGRRVHVADLLPGERYVDFDAAAHDAGVFQLVATTDDGRVASGRLVRSN